MNEIEELKQDIFSRYKLWVEKDVIEDITGMLKACLDNFQKMLNDLVQKAYEAGQNSH